MIRDFLNLIRLQHWIKNFFVFIPVFFNKQLLSVESLEMSIIGFFCFSLVASSVYCFNDIIDVEYDKLHEEKKKRPIASGKTTINKAIKVMISLLIIGFVISFSVSNYLLYVLVCYFILNIWYSLKAKKIAYLDVFLIGVSFLLRVLAGAVVTNTPLSVWIVSLVFSLALFLALLKRKDEFRLYQKGVVIRESLHQYSENTLNFLIKLLAVLIILLYSLYLIFSPFVKNLENNYAYFTILFVIIGLKRYLYIVENKKYYANPTSVIFKDWPMQLILTSWLLSFYLSIY